MIRFAARVTGLLLIPCVLYREYFGVEQTGNSAISRTGGIGAVFAY